jgi:Rnl2 family RNA ligase
VTNLKTGEGVMFKKYSSIENHYQNKHINFFLDLYPELENCGYVIEEKYDGANISVCIGDEVRWAKRSCVIADDCNFMGLQDIKSDYNPFINQLMIEYPIVDTIQAYGEIFGPKIQKRINYGDQKRILFYDMAVNGDLIPPVEFHSTLEKMGFAHLRVRVFTFVWTLKEALAFDPHIKNEYGSLIEGVVIKPYYKVYRSPVGERFVIKKKNPEFGEKEQKVKKDKPQKVYREEVVKLEEEFSSLVNKNRVLSVFSKEGEIEKANDIGKYIKLVLEDAKEDLLKEFSLPEDLTREEEKYIFSSQGKKIVPILKEYLWFIDAKN